MKSSEKSCIGATKNKTDEKSARPVKPPKLIDLINAEFKSELHRFIESEQPLQIGDLVLARMRGYWPWPGRVENFSSNNKIVGCYFFGTHNRGPVGSKNVLPFVDASETVRLACVNPPDIYMKAIKEVEYECGVPEELSVLNALKCIK